MGYNAASGSVMTRAAASMAGGLPGGRVDGPARTRLTPPPPPARSGQKRP